MGNQQTKEIYNQNEWEILAKSPDFNIIKNKIQQLEYQEHTKVISDQNQFYKQKNLYELRKQEMVNNVVKVEKIRYNIKKQMCSTFYELITYYQYFPFTLEKVQYLDFEYFLYVFLEVLTATNYLLRLYPEFQINQDKIFINQEGMIKLWISHNIAENQINGFEEQQQTLNFLDKVQKIYNLLQMKTLPDVIPLDFIQPIRNNLLTIDEAVSHIKLYCFENKIKIPGSMKKFLWKQNIFCPRKTQNKLTLTKTKVSILKQKNTNITKSLNKTCNLTQKNSIIQSIKQSSNILNPNDWTSKNLKQNKILYYQQ